MTTRYLENLSGINIGDYTKILAAQKAFILVFCISATLVSLTITYFISEKYESGTTILYTPTETIHLRAKGTETFGAPSPVTPFKVILQTIRDAAKNESVLRPVVKKLKLDQEIKAQYDTWYMRWYEESKAWIKARIMELKSILKYGRIIEEDPTVSAIIKLRKNMDIVSTKDSFIYVLTVRDKFPKRAAMIVDEIGSSLVEFLRNQYLGPARDKLAQLKLQVNTINNELDQLREKREQLLIESKFVSLDDETSKGLANLYEMELEDVRLSTTIEQKRKKVARLKKNIAFGAKNYMESDVYKKLKSDLLFEKIELKSLEAGRQHLVDSINQAKSEMELMPLVKEKLENIELKMGSVTRAHEHTKDLLTEMQTQIHTFFNGTRVLHKATPPAKPVQPIKIYHVGLSLAISMMLSIGLAFVFDFLNIRTFYSAKSLATLNRQEQIPQLLETKQMDYSVLSPSLLEEFARQFNASGGSLFYKCDDGLELVHSLDPGHTPPALPFPLRQGSVFEWALQTQQPATLEDFQKEQPVQFSGWKGYKGESLMVLPLKEEDGQIIGLLSLHDRPYKPFNIEEKERGIQLWSTYLSNLKKNDLAPALYTESHGPLAVTAQKDVYKSIVVIIGTAILGSCLAGAVYYFLNKLGY